MKTFLDICEVLITILREDEELEELVGDRIYSEIAPTQQEFPLILFRFSDNPDVITSFGDDLLLISYDFELVAIGAGNNLIALEPITTKISEILQGFTSDTDDYFMNCWQWLPTISRTETLNGTTRTCEIGSVWQVIFRGKGNL